MALTAEQMRQLEQHWSLVIQTIYAGIEEIPKGDGDTIADLLSTWRGAYLKPDPLVIEDTLLNTVLPLVQAELQARAEATTHKGDVKTRLLNSALASKSPDEIYTLMQGQIDGWASLAEAKADLRVWLPLMAAAIVWLVNEP
jgi:hypothetical protein